MGAQGSHDDPGAITLQDEVLAAEARARQPPPGRGPPLVPVLSGDQPPTAEQQELLRRGREQEIARIRAEAMRSPGMPSPPLPPRPPPRPPGTMRRAPSPPPYAPPMQRPPAPQRPPPPMRPMAPSPPPPMRPMAPQLPPPRRVVDMPMPPPAPPFAAAEGVPMAPPAPPLAAYQSPMVPGAPEAPMAPMAPEAPPAPPEAPAFLPPPPGPPSAPTARVPRPAVAPTQTRAPPPPSSQSALLQAIQKQKAKTQDPRSIVRLDSRLETDCRGRPPYVDPTTGESIPYYWSDVTGRCEGCPPGQFYDPRPNQRICRPDSDFGNLTQPARTAKSSAAAAKPSLAELAAQRARAIRRQVEPSNEGGGFPVDFARDGGVVPQWTPITWYAQAHSYPKATSPPVGPRIGGDSGKGSHRTHGHSLRRSTRSVSRHITATPEHKRTRRHKSRRTKK